jgi:hypothetical protein
MNATESRFVSYWKTTKIDSTPTFTASLRTRKDFINPYILERVVDKLKIDEYGSNFLSTTKRRHTPYDYAAENFYLVLREMEAASITEDTRRGSILASVTSVGVTKEEKNQTHFGNGNDPIMCELSNPEAFSMEFPPHTSPNQQGGDSFDCSRVQKKSRWQ